MLYFHYVVNVFLDYCYCHLGLAFTVEVYRNWENKAEKRRQMTPLSHQLNPHRTNSLQWREKRRREALGTSTSVHGLIVMPCMFLLPSRWQQWVESLQRRLPVCDSNLWSISITGGGGAETVTVIIMWNKVFPRKPTCPSATLSGERGSCLQVCVLLGMWFPLTWVTNICCYFLHFVVFLAQ